MGSRRSRPAGTKREWRHRSPGARRARFGWLPRCESREPARMLRAREHVARDGSRDRARVSESERGEPARGKKTQNNELHRRPTSTHRVPGTIFRTAKPRKIYQILCVSWRGGTGPATGVASVGMNFSLVRQTPTRRDARPRVPQRGALTRPDISNMVD